MSLSHPPATPEPVSDQELADLLRRVRETRLVADPWPDDAARGIGATELEDLLRRWTDGFDWREQERRLRRLPWAIAGDDRRALRVLHQPAARPNAPAVVLLHGWPDSVLRFERLLPLLTELDVVVPALPGFPFALEHDQPVSVATMASAVLDAVTALGYERVTLSAGDVGADVAEVLAATHPERIHALHLTNVSARHALTADPAHLDPEARAYLDAAGSWFRTEGGYIHQQSTRPRPLMVGLGDSAAGLAAWLLDKLGSWSEDVAESFTPDELLTWISAWWFGGAIGTSFSTYAEPADVPGRTDVPTVVSRFAADTKPAPRSFVEAFVDLRAFVEHEHGGHFAAWEQPELYAADVRLAVSVGDEARS